MDDNSLWTRGAAAWGNRQIGGGWSVVAKVMDGVLFQAPTSVWVDALITQPGTAT
jgi:hypothetical protein